MANATEAPFWGPEWMAASQRQWADWADWWRQHAEPDPKAPTGSQGWAEVLERWGRILSPPAPPKSSELLERLLDQSRAFLQFGEQFAAGLAESSNVFQTAEEWRRALQKLAESWGSGAEPPADAAIAAFWKLPFDTWNRTLSSASLFPGDFLEAQKPETWSRIADDLHRDLARFLSVPGLGYTREVQEQGQELVRLVIEYQRAAQAYAATFRTLSLDTLERLQGRLSDRAKQGDPITSLRGLYDLWVDSSEEAYFALVSTEAYAEAYGRMVNALMALKRHGRNIVDEVVGALGLPTRQGLATLQQRQQELRREVATLRRGVTDAGSLRAEMTQLRTDLERLRTNPARRSAPRPRRARKADHNVSEEG
jgi:class III poly(R)-hydroxyalkanoic acid synthase PhaE subunit